MTTECEHATYLLTYLLTYTCGHPNASTIWSSKCYPLTKPGLILLDAYSGADPEGGEGGARPLVFAPNSVKSPLNWPKYA